MILTFNFNDSYLHLNLFGYSDSLTKVQDHYPTTFLKKS